MRSLHSLRRAPGFSLVELLIGLVIGMLAVVVMMQVFSVSEGYKRTTTGGDDAQNNAAVGLYGLQRDMRQGGMGVSGFQLIGCNVLLRAGVTLNAISPVTINHASIPAGDANTDTLLIVYGNPNGAGEGEKIEAQPSQKIYTVAAAAPSATASGAFAQDDQVIVEAQTRPSPCNLTMDKVASVASTNVTMTGAGVAGVSGGIIYNLGQAPKVLAYAVRGGSLTVCDYTVSNCSTAAGASDPTIWVPITSDVVSLRAEYGQDTSTPMDGTVDAWSQTTPTTQCLWARASAVRLVLVARSAQFDKNTVTTAAPVWASTAAPIDLSGLTDWGHYRYKMFQTVVPLRNIAWQGAQSGC